MLYETYYDKLQPFFGLKNLQCHSIARVTKDTPIKLRRNENIKILRVDEIINEEDWYHDDNVKTQKGYEEFAHCEGVQIWISEGWKKIKKINRHKTEKNSS